MSDDEDAVDVGEESLPLGVTREMAEALIALRRTPMRSDANVSSSIDACTDVLSDVCGRELQPSRVIVSDSSSNSDYSFRFSQSTMASASVRNVSPVAGASGIYASSWSMPSISVVSDKSAMSRGMMSCQRASSSGRYGLSTASLSVPVSSITVDSRTQPISSTVSRPIPLLNASSEIVEIGRLNERLSHMEERLFGTQLNDQAHMTFGGRPNTLQKEPVVALGATPASTRRPGGHFATTYDRQDDAKPYLPNVKLGTYRGDTSLETFLAKFNNCSRYLNWNDRDRFFHLSNALDGAAGQVLWDANSCDSVEALIQLLRNRFGNQNQVERYRAELKVRRRHQGESLQMLYQDICKLMALAYPGWSNDLSDVIAKDAFLDALDDPKLRREILVQQPQNLDSALAIASRLEAYDKDPNEYRDSEGSCKRGKNKYVRAATVDESVSEVESRLSKRVDQMESKLDAILTQLSSQQQTNYVSQSPATAPGAQVQQRSDYINTGQNSTRVPRNVCKTCFQKGHWAKFCPQTRNSSSGGSAATQTTGDVHASVISGSNKQESTAVYLKIRVGGRLVHCLLDSGCEKSVINNRLVEGMTIERTEQRLYAANGSEVPVSGVVRLRLNVQGVPTELSALVSDAVEDAILGVDWLTEYSIQWNFGDKAIRLNGKRIALSSRPARNLVRRLYVSEPVVVPPGHVAEVPVTATLRDLHIPKTEWATDARQLKKNVLAARTLINPVGTKSAIRVVNVGDRACELSAGQFVGNAMPVEVTDGRSEATTTSEHSQQVPSSSVTNRNNSVPEHVVCLLDNLPSDMSDSDKEEVKSFVCANADVFSKSEYDIGRTHLVRHQIDTGNHPPIKQPLRRHPMAYWPIIDQHVEEMLANDIIEPTASPWASNVVIIRKQDGNVRFCVDYRRLNDVTRKDSYPLPRIEDCLSALGGACYFSTLDLRAGYWQTAMDEKDADKTAFVTRRGVFRFKVLSFGLANAPALFQRLMDYVLAGLTWEACLVYIDDIIIWADSFSNHLHRLSQVFQRLRAANLKLKSSKCRLFQRKVSFLGHVISSAGIEPDPKKISSVVGWPIPSNLTELRAFVGLASYYRRHVKGFADIARPLHELTRKKEPFRWTDRRQEAFDRLKRCLVTAPVIAAPLDNGQYVLDTDASDIGLGAVLQQEQPDGLRVIAYASRALSRAELSYCTTKKEMLALTYGLKVFRQYLLARDFILRTDHAALTHLRRTPEPIGQQARWLDLIAEFNFTIKHRSGESNKNADGLSRRVCEQNCRHCARQFHVNAVRTVMEAVAGESNFGDDRELADVDEDDDAEGSQAVFVFATRTAGTELLADAELFTSEAVKQAQADDETIAPIIQWLHAGMGKPEWKQLEMLSEDTRTLWGQFESMQLVDDVVYRKFHRTDGTVDRMQLVMPRSLRNQFLKLVHEGAGGHFAVRKTQEQVQRRAYWPGWRRTVEQFIRRCLPCAQYQGSKPIRQGALQSFEANGPGDRYCIDLVGPYPRTKRNKKYILTVLDAYTRYLISVALPEKTATCVSRALIEEVFFKIGCPRSLQSDLGTEFQNQILDNICSILGIQKLRTTVHRPSANGRCEKSHRTISACLAKLVAINQTDWDEKLPLVVFAMNCAKSEATNYAPFELMYGRLPRMPVEMVLDLPAESYPADLDQYAEEFSERLREANQIVQQHTRTAFARMKRNYDARVRESEYVVGQYVLFFYPRRYRGRNPKLARPNIGPFRILRRLNDVNFVIAMTPKSRKMVVHIDKLKPWYGEEPQCWAGVSVPTGDQVAEEMREPTPTTEVDNVDETDLPTLENVFDQQADQVAEEPREVEPVTEDRKTSSATATRSKIPVKKSVQRSAAVDTDTATKCAAEASTSAQSKRVNTPVKLSTRCDGRPTRNVRPPARYRE